MNETKNKLSKESTFYQYKLVKRITYPPALLSIYFSFLLVYIIILGILTDILQLIYMGIGAVLLQGVYALLILFICTTQGRWRAPQWGIAVQSIWFGLIPKQQIGVRHLHSLHWQIAAIGTALILCIVPWASFTFVFSLLILHGWFMLPRLCILVILYGHNKAGFIKINPKDSSLYTQ